MALYRRGTIYWYDFVIAGRRYRGSTKQTNQGKARTFESTLMADIVARGPQAVPRKAPTLTEFSTRFLPWVEQHQLLNADTKRYYRFGWDRLSKTALADMRLDQITTEVVNTIVFDGSPSWGNQARRTLRRMLSKAVDAKLLWQAPRIHLAREYGREALMDDGMEAQLLEHASPILRDVIIVMRDTGMRPEEVFRMRWEHVHWDKHMYFNASGKTRKARRWVPLSQRVEDVLRERVAKSREWVFESEESKTGHVNTVSRQFRNARKAAGLPDSVVLYLARHAFGTYTMSVAKDPALVREAMGHENLSTTMKYTHPDLSRLRDIIDQRNVAAMSQSMTQRTA